MAAQPGSPAPQPEPQIGPRFPAAGGWRGDEVVPRWLAVGSAIALRLGIIVGGIYVVGFAALNLLIVVIPLLISILLTTLLIEPVHALRRLGVPNGLAAVLVLLSGLALFAAVIALIIPPFVDQVGEVGSSVRQGIKEIGTSLKPLGVQERDIDQALDEVRGGYRQLGSGLLSGAIVIVQWLAATILTVMLTFFLVKDGERLWRSSLHLFAAERRQAVSDLGDRAWSVFRTYIRGVAFVASIDAALIGTALVIVGVPLVLPLMVLTFIAAFFPVVGAISAGIVATLVTLVTTGEVAAIIIAATILVVQQVEGNIMYPMVVGPRLRLHPVVMLLALAIGGVLAGVAGAFLAAPIAAVTAALINYAHEEKQSPVVIPAETDLERP